MRRKVCICSFEIDGPKRGGIGTAYASLAEVLAAAGHDVTLLFAGDRCEQGSIPEWQAHFARLGIRFEALPPLAEPVGPVDAVWQVQFSYRAYLYLKTRDFDVVHFPEVLGIGYYALLARRQGLAFRNTTLCVGAHGPSQWVREANGAGPFQPPIWAAIQDFLERRSIELAPVLVSPSAYLFRWMEERGWPLADNRHVLQNVLRAAVTNAPGAAGGALEELVFFGRLEARKGVVLFCDAVERALAGGATAPRITFLGWPAKDPIEGLAADAWIRRRCAAWRAPVQFIANLDPAGALAYLRGAGRLAVMPSPVAENSPYTVLECLASGIPFVTTDVGGIPELVAAADRASVCVAPTAAALAQRLGEARGGALRAARPAVGADAAREAWLAWHQTPAVPPLARAPERPLVSLCVSGSMPVPQTYAPLETIVVEGASPGARRRAVERARGEYVLFGSADASWIPSAAETLVTAVRHSGADVLTCLSRTATPAARVGLFTAGPASAGLAGNVFGDAHAFFRRDALLRLEGPDDDEGQSPDDRATLAHAALQGLRIEVVPEVLLEHPRARPRRLALPPAYGEAMPPALRDLPETVSILAAASRAGAISRATAREMREAPGGAWLLGDSPAHLADGNEAASFVRAVLRSPAWHLLGPLRALALLWKRLRE